MLRLLQTNVLSAKVVKLFDTLTRKSSVQAKPLLVEIKRPSTVHLMYSDAPLSAARRRRMRRSPIASASGSMRSSWF